MKKCVKFGEYKDESEFNWRRKFREIRQSISRECQKGKDTVIIYAIRMMKKKGPMAFGTRQAKKPKSLSVNSCYIRTWQFKVTPSKS